MFKMTLKAAVIVGLTASLSACAGVSPGPYNGLDTSDAGAKTKIGCFDYNDDLTPEKAKVCEDQAVKCQVQQNRMSSPFAETIVANGVASAGLGSASQTQQVKALGAVAKVVGKYAVAGALGGAIGSVNGSAIIWSQSNTAAVGSCSRDFLNRYKTLHPRDKDIMDVFIEPELVRANIRANVKHR